MQQQFDEVDVIILVLQRGEQRVTQKLKKNTEFE